MNHKSIFFLVIILYLFTPSFAQVGYRIHPESVMTITGTSTIHDWTSKVNTINGNVVFLKEAKDKTLPKSGVLATSIRLEIPVKSIESPRGVVMDNKTYDALKSEEHPNILFLLKENKITEITDKTNNKFRMQVSGTLTVAGFSRDISFTLNGQRLADMSYRFDGSYPMKMTDYQVEPPSAMFGQIVTGDEITIAFDLLLNELK